MYKPQPRPLPLMAPRLYPPSFLRLLPRAQTPQVLRCSAWPCSVLLHFAPTAEARSTPGRLSMQQLSLSLPPLLSRPRPPPLLAARLPLQAHMRPLALPQGAAPRTHLPPMAPTAPRLGLEPRRRRRWWDACMWPWTGATSGCWEAFAAIDPVRSTPLNLAPSPRSRGGARDGDNLAILPGAPVFSDVCVCHPLT